MKNFLCSILSIATCLVYPLAAAQDWQVPRTASGNPNLEGYWTNETQTPLQRDVSLGNKLALSAEEAQAAEEQRRDYLEIANSDIDPDRSAPTDGFVDASYNQFWLDGFDEMMTVNGEFRTSIIVDPANGRIPFLPGKETPMYYVAPPPPGFTILDGPEVRPLGDRCLTSFGYHAGPVMLPFLYNNNYQIVQTDDYIVILVEMVHDTRIIRMKDSALPENMSQWMGDALGHWEGDTLVVESRNFNSNQHFFNASMDNLLVTERFTRVAQDRINYKFSVDDLSAFSSQWSGELPFVAKPAGEKIYEYACHEGNYALPSILAGARVQEADAAKNAEK